MTIGRIPSVEGGIQPTIFDAKADLLTATAADTPARLAVGNNGEQLLADSSATTGLRWTATPSASNPVINGGFEIWQRGTSGLGPGAYTADRWYLDSVSGRTVSRQTTSDTTNLPNIQYCARVQRTSTNTSTSVISISQSFETVNSIPFVGKTVTLSFYARKGADFSAASNILTAYIVSGTGTDQNQRNGYTGQSLPIQQNATLTTTWQRFSYTATISSSANEIAVLFEYVPVGTAGTNDYFEITGVQLDIGSVALPFRRAGGTLAGELAACQRYYEQSFAAGTAPSQGASATTNGVASAYSASDMRTQRFDFKVTKRSTPTMTYYRSNDTATDGRWVYYVSGWTTPTATSNGLVNVDSFNVYLTSSSAFTVRDCYIVEGGGWTASAEL